MAIKFNTYTELGEAVRKKNPKAFEGRNSESIGIDFSEKFGSKFFYIFYFIQSTSGKCLDVPRRVQPSK